MPKHKGSNGEKVMGGHAVNVYLLFFRCISGKTQEEGLRRVEELKAELTSLKESTREDKKSQTELTQQVTDLSEELTKEKVSSLFLSANHLHSHVTLPSNVMNCE